MPRSAIWRTASCLNSSPKFDLLFASKLGNKASTNLGAIQTFGVVRRDGARFNLLKLAPLLEDIHERLSGVVVECLPWRSFIERYDRPGMLLYLDPPYWGNERDYGNDVFGRQEFAEMAEVLKGLKGAFILSLNAVQGVFETFKDFTIEEVDCTYSVSGRSHNKIVREVIIST